MVESLVIGGGETGSRADGKILDTAAFGHCQLPNMFYTLKVLILIIDTGDEEEVLTHNAPPVQLVLTRLARRMY
jgi:hypothetical protein